MQQSEPHSVLIIHCSGRMCNLEDHMLKTFITALSNELLQHFSGITGLLSEDLFEMNDFVATYKQVSIIKKGSN